MSAPPILVVDDPPVVVDPVVEPVVITPDPGDFDPLLSDISDPIFQGDEPVRGLRPMAERLEAWPEDAKQDLHNIRVGYRKRREEEAAAARTLTAEKEALAARIAALEAEIAGKPAAEAPAAPAVVPTLALPPSSDPRFRRLYGQEDGDWAEGVELDADPFEGLTGKVGTLDEETLSDPAKLEAKIDAALAPILEASRKAVARADAVAKKLTREAHAASMKAYTDAETARTAETAAQKAVRDWRDAHPGMADEAAFGAVLDTLDTLDPQKALHGPAAMDIAYKAWKADQPALAVAAPAPVVAAPVVAPVAAPVVTPPDAVAELMEKLRLAASGQMSRATHGLNGVVSKMPKGLTPEQEKEWRNAHPEVQAAYDTGDIREIRKVVEA